MTKWSCFRFVGAAIYLAFIACSQARASEFEFYDVADDRPSYVKYLEPFFTVVTAYQVQSAPHEGVHAATAYTFGTKTKYWDVKLLKQSVSYDKENSERRSEDVFFTSMSAPVFSRLTCDLPRWVHAPDGPGYWSRWTSGYWIMSYSTTWVTLIGTWASYSKKNNESGWDFNNASLAATSKKSTVRVCASPPYLTYPQVDHQIEPNFKIKSEASDLYDRVR